MPVPRSFVEAGLLKAKGATLFGVPVEHLTREELIAMAMTGWEEYENERARGNVVLSELFKGRPSHPPHVAVIL